jgi:hypothetical protein
MSTVQTSKPKHEGRLLYTTNDRTWTCLPLMMVPEARWATILELTNSSTRRTDVQCPKYETKHENKRVVMRETKPKECFACQPRWSFKSSEARGQTLQRTWSRNQCQFLGSMLPPTRPKVRNGILSSKSRVLSQDLACTDRPEMCLKN